MRGRDERRGRARRSRGKEDKQLPGRAGPGPLPQLDDSDE